MQLFEFILNVSFIFNRPQLRTPAAAAPLHFSAFSGRLARAPRVTALDTSELGSRRS